MSSRYRLNRLEVAAFRGAREKIAIPLDKPLIIIFGPNGSGKSTLTTAVEWALFPREADLQTEHKIDERRDWQIRHVHANAQPSVVLNLSAGEELHVIQQTGTRPARRGRASSDARPAIRCTYGDFKSLAFVHQETIRDFIVGQPAPRQQAFQRLLGAGWAHELAKAIGGAAKKLNCDDADHEVQRLNDRVDDRLSAARQQLREEEEAASKLDLIAPWQQAARGQVANVESRISSLGTDADIAVPDLPDGEPFGDYSGRLAGVLQELRTKGPAQRHTEFAGRKTQMEGARSSFRSAKQTWTTKDNELKEARKVLGTEEQLKRRIKELDEKQSRIRTSLKELDQERNIMREALEYFIAVPDPEYCPACLRPDVPTDIRERLQKQLFATSTEEQQKLQADLENVNKELEKANGAGENLKTRSEELDRAKEAIGQERTKLARALRRVIRDDEDPVAVADAEIGKLESEINVINQAVQQLHKRIATIETEAKKVDQIGRIIALEERVTSLGQIRKSSEWEAMIEAQRTLSRREQVFKHATHAVRRLGAQLAERNLERARRPITDMYARLTRRSDFPTVTIDAEEKFAIGIKGDRSGHPATAVLNQTDLSALAIAVVAGMATSFPEVHDLEFLILDDPSQGMDEDVTRRLGEAISDLSAELQMIVATPAPILLDALEKSPRSKNVIRLKPRDQQSTEPFVTVESVSSD